MRRDIALAGFVLTAAEWDALDELARSQLLAVALRRDEPWIVAAPTPRERAEADAPEVYESYQLVFA